jgi:protease-4
MNMNVGKTFLAALLAVVVGFGVVIMFWTMIIVGMVSAFGSSPAAVVSSGSVLRLNLGTVSDSPSSSPFDGFDFQRMSVVPKVTLLGAVRAIQAAADDDRIEGIYINFDEQADVSFSALEELRAALEGFKESGKFVVAYQEYFGQAGYWFSSVADEVYVNPAGGLQWTGLAVNVMFYKGLLDKLGIEPVVVRHGSFKSAVEPFILDKMSPENRLQYEKMAGTVWRVMVEQAAASRGVAEAELQAMADNLTIDSPAAALEKGLVDSVWYEDQVMDRISSLAGMSGDEDPKIVSFGDYASQVTATNLTSKNKIAVIYAEGSIVSGKGSNGEVGSEAMVEKIRKARKDEGTVGVVLRINSPGGSALASDVIWRELELLKAEKPLIVSMGELAASGGYWIAAPADAIYANRSTLTGSIGVFGIYANVGGALKDKLGVTTDVVTTGRWADMGSPFRAPSAAELAYIQKSIEDVYSTFLDHVSAGRNMTPEAVDAIGQGRVWAGADALEIGLIDGFGGIVDAISLAADRVGVAGDFRIWEVTDPLSPFDVLLGGLSTSVRRWVMQDDLGESFAHYEYLRGMLDRGGVQARLPFVLEIN